MTPTNASSAAMAKTAHIDGRTRLVGVMGWPTEHSLSPRMHNAAFAAAGLNWVYVPLAVHPSRLPDAMRGLAALGFAGANVTVPHKQTVIPFVDVLTPIAKAIGAVNTVTIRSDGRVMGDNTDGAGFLADLLAHGIALGATATQQTHKPITPVLRAAVIGAGGAARAVVHVLATAGVSVSVVARSIDAASTLCQSIADVVPGASALLSAHVFPDSLLRIGAEPDLIVNATSLGLHPNDSLPWRPDVLFRPEQTVYDLVYGHQTSLLSLAGACGARAIGGLGMLVRQGALAFESWTGQQAPLDVMRRATAPRDDEVARTNDLRPPRPGASRARREGDDECCDF